ncbi:MAG: hypothetical protein HPY45_11005 [Anaerolineae bacterium]|nr:hypothetical protein [Anaerolineae bacterium]
MDFFGHPVNRITSPFLSLDYLSTAGPRIVRLMLAGSEENLLAETPDLSWQHKYGHYHIYGGHRLWHAPERVESSIPDDEPPLVEHLADGVRLIQPVEAPTHLRKMIKIQLHQDRAAVTLDHTLKNEGNTTLTCGAWGITMLRGGGTAILPMRLPDADKTGLLPDRQVVFWPYTLTSDPRLHVEDDCVRVEALEMDNPLKVGVFSPLGWVTYRIGNVLFRKTFDPLPGMPHPDMGCNCSVYTRWNYIEIESMGALLPLEAGGELHHREVWEIEKVS